MAEEHPPPWAQKILDELAVIKRNQEIIINYLKKAADRWRQTCRYIKL